MKTVTLKFTNWREPSDKIDVAPTTCTKVISFTNDGQFTTNSETDQKIPMNQDDFDKIINVYINHCGAELIPEQINN